MNYKIRDNFLPSKNLKYLSNLFLDYERFYYFYAPHQVEAKKDTSYHFHSFYKFGQKNSIFVDEINDNFLKFLNYDSIINCRLNLTLNRKEPIRSGVHTDTRKPGLTSIFYLNSNNGKTVLFINDEEVMIESVENRLLIFDNNIEHCSISHTNTEHRLVINTNYMI